MNKQYAINTISHLPDHMQQISVLLTQLSATLTDFNNELDRENQAVRKRDTETLIAATNAKIVLLQSIEADTNILSNLMIQHGYQDEQTGIKKGALAFELGEIWTEFCDQLEASYEKNTINARTIELSRVTTDRIVDMLRGNKKSVYGRAGKMQDNCEVNTLAEA